MDSPLKFDADCDGALMCPVCGFNYIHHVQVDVYARREDDGTGLHVRVDAGDRVRGPQKFGAVEFDERLDGNPSSRRGGIAIRFRCEECRKTSVLTIAQHKGMTYVEFQEAGK